mmetsp:Transcript_63570/g.132339  ORF Transcript_63570/g.132339 Transcript_63570/m.132339 type:complete len:110 (-) Transcript_63570:1523-1852(-)
MKYPAPLPPLARLALALASPAVDKLPELAPCDPVSDPFSSDWCDSDRCCWWCPSVPVDRDPDAGVRNGTIEEEKEKEEEEEGNAFAVADAAEAHTVGLRCSFRMFSLDK